LSHPGQAQLDAAVGGARRRPLGDAGLWAWDRRCGSTFLAPLVAATLARFGAWNYRRLVDPAIGFGLRQCLDGNARSLDGNPAQSSALTARPTLTAASQHLDGSKSAP
jgi:hypothetical protein